MYFLDIDVAFDSKNQATGFFKSIKPELMESYQRSQTKIFLKKNSLNIKISAVDKTALRASLNSILKPLILFQELEELWMSKEDKRVLIMEFERDRKLLMTISSQKQQLSIQIEIMKASLEELSKTKETKVYKAVGNLLVPKTVEEMKKETQERKESFELKLKTVEKQEESLLKKLNSLKAKIEGTEKEESSDEKKEKKSKK